MDERNDRWTRPRSRSKTAQGWIEPDVAELPGDLCSHGDIRLVIGGQLITPGESGQGFTISTSALALLRTLESDHHAARPVADRLILCCGGIEILTCPIGIDWSVTHLGGRVRLADAIRYDTTDESQAARFPGLMTDLAEGDYRKQIVAFAEKARQPFAGAKQTPADDCAEELYDDFWREYDARLSRAIH